LSPTWIALSARIYKKAAKGKGPAAAAAAGGGRAIETEQDAMGLTSQPPLAAGPRATLIVCPLSVLSNWQGRISNAQSIPLDLNL